MGGSQVRSLLRPPSLSDRFRLYTNPKGSTMKFVLTIPASNGHAEADVTIDGNAKVHAVKAVRALGNFGLKQALDLVNEFLAFPNTAAEDRLIDAIVTNRRSPQEVHDDLHTRNVRLNNEIANLRDAIYREQNDNEVLRNTIHDLRQTISDLRSEVESLLVEQPERKAKIVREAQDEAMPVIYHGSIRHRHGAYTAFSDGDGTYRLIHPAYDDEALNSVGWDSFTVLRGCEV